jgi:hypothetical protein
MMFLPRRGRIVKKKSTLMRFLMLLIFRARGGVLNTFNSLISPAEYKSKTSVEIQSRAEKLIDLLAPYPSKSELKLVGSHGDGGYFMNRDDLLEAKYLVSGGIENNNTFEYELAELGIEGLQIDNSIDSAPLTHKNLQFIKATLGWKGSDTFSINDHIERSGMKDIVLKLDIEGAELNVINSITKLNFQKINVVIMEIHNLDHIFKDGFWVELSGALTLLRDAGLFPCFISPNNATSSEILGGLSIPRNIEVTMTREKNLRKVFNYEDLVPIHVNQQKNLDGLSSVNIDHIIFRKVLHHV